jgi:hypothetical protein
VAHIRQVSCRYRCPQYPSLVVLRESFKTYKDRAFIVSWARKLLSNQQPVACVWRLICRVWSGPWRPGSHHDARRSTWWQWRPSRVRLRCGQCEPLYTPVNGAPAQGFRRQSHCDRRKLRCHAGVPGQHVRSSRRCVPATSWACSRERWSTTWCAMQAKIVPPFNLPGAVRFNDALAQERGCLKPPGHQARRHCRASVRPAAPGVQRRAVAPT